MDPEYITRRVPGAGLPTGYRVDGMRWSDRLPGWRPTNRLLRTTWYDGVHGRLRDVRRGLIMSGRLLQPELNLTGLQDTAQTTIIVQNC